MSAAPALDVDLEPISRDAFRCDAYERTTRARCTNTASTLAACPTGAGPLQAICASHFQVFTKATGRVGCCIGCQHVGSIAEILTQHWTLTPVGGTK